MIAPLPVIDELPTAGGKRGVILPTCDCSTISSGREATVTILRQKGPHSAFSAAICLALASVASACALASDDVRDKAREQLQLTTQHYIRDNDAAKARAGLLAAIQLDPTYPQPRYNLAMLAEVEEKWDEAIDWLQKYRTLDGTSKTSSKAQLEIERLTVVRDLDKTPEGKLKRRYNDAIARGQKLAAIGLPKSAVLEADAAVKMNPNRYEAYALAAACLARQGQYDRAIAFVKMAIDRSDASSKPRLQAALAKCENEANYQQIGIQGSAALDAGKYKDAAALFENGWKLFPRRGTYGLAAALALASSGDIPKATEYLNQLKNSKDQATARRAQSMLARISAHKPAQAPPASAH